MDITSVLGFIIAAAAIYFGAPDLRNELHAYLDLDSFILVFIGSIACVIIASTAKEVFFSSRRRHTRYEFVTGV
eukprot:COSAG02_NODE_4872_length_4876_cov_2.153862_6_plen_73_part_01